MTSKAQLSIEYLLLTAVLLSVFAIFVTAASSLFQAGLFAVDVKNLEIFSSEMEKSINFLSVLSDGSKKELTAKPLNEWKIFSNSETLSFKTENEKLNQEKTIGFQPSLTPQLSVSNISPNTKLILEKQGLVVLIKNS